MSKTISVSKFTMDKVSNAKQYIENKYAQQILEDKQKSQQWNQLIKKMQMCNLPEDEQIKLKTDILH